MKPILFSLLVFLNCLAQVKPIPLSNCNQLTTAPGPEDFAFDKDSGILYISSHNRRNEAENGFLFTVNLNDKDQSLKKVDIVYPKDFRPHGISFVNTSLGKKLYIVSHTKRKEDPHTLEVFNLEKNNIRFEKTLYDPALIHPNDVFVFNDGRILVSNDMVSSSKFTEFLLLLFKIKTGHIAYFDKTSWTTFDTKVVFANGIHVRNEAGKEMIYLADTVNEKILKLELLTGKNKPELNLVKEIQLDTGPDNFLEDDNGRLIFAAHKSGVQFLKHASSKTNLSPSQIFILDKEDKLTEIYANVGDQISGSSSGFIYKNKLYIAQVFEPFLLKCDLVN